MMRRIALLILLSLLIPSMAWATNWCADANIVACYPLETGSGTTAVDKSSNSNSATFKGAGEPAWNGTDTAEDDLDGDFQGTSNYSVTVDAADDNAVKTTINNPPTGDGTYAVWAERTTWAGSNSSGILEFYDSGGTDRRAMYITASEDLYIFSNDTSNGTGVDRIDLKVTDGDWEHFAIAQDEDNSANNIAYINGVDETDFNEDFNVRSNLDTLVIFAYNSNTAGFGGGIDELAIFNDVKDSTDINDMMDNGIWNPASARRVIMIN